MLSMAKVLKSDLEVWRSISVPKSSFWVRTSIGKFFSIMALPDVMKGGTPYMGISPEERTRAHIDQSESKSAPINALLGTRSGRMSLKKCVVGCKGKITLFSVPKEPSVTWTVDAVWFSGQQWSFASVFVDECFINKAQIDAGFAHRLILKDGAVPAIKIPFMIQNCRW